MAKGYNLYKDIQGKMREAQIVDDYDEIQKLISDYKQKPYDKKALMNTLEHVWGFLRKRLKKTIKSNSFCCWMN
jgi:uncharacterized protein YbgA (DUF1722 family)